MAETDGARPVRIGFGGAGRIAQVCHMANYALNPNAEIVALSEMREKLGRLIGETMNVPKVYRSHDELVADPDVDAVVVATFRWATGPIARDALKAGKAVLSEKPMAQTVDQARVLVEAARESGAHYSVGYMKRHDAGVQEGKRLFDELVGSGELGAVVLMRSYCFFGDYAAEFSGFRLTDERRQPDRELWAAAPDWMPEAMHGRYDGFLNRLSHDINLLRFIAGERPKVNAVNLDLPGSQSAMMECADYPVVLESSTSRFNGWDEGIDIHFERGRLQILVPSPMARGVPARVILDRGDGTRGRWEPHIQPSWSFRRQADAFVAEIRDGAQQLSPGEDAIIDLEMAEEMWRLQAEREA